MIIKFNASGTQVNKGLLNVRLDIYPDETSKTYSLHHVLKPDEPIPLSLFNLNGTLKEPDYSNWLASVAKHWETNPMLCQFITVPETVKLEDVKLYIAQLVIKDVLATLDSVLVLPKSIHYVSPYMRGKYKFGTAVQTKDFADLIASVNQKLSTLAVDIIGGTAEAIEPQTIDIGPGATDRASGITHANITMVNLGNPANANGTIDTAEIWLTTAGTGARVGTASGSGTSWTTRDSDAIGNVAAGSKQTFTGLSYDVNTDDCFVSFFGTGASEFDIAGESGLRYVSGEYIDPNDAFTTNNYYPAGATSFYGTGAEVSGFVPKIIFM